MNAKLTRVTRKLLDGVKQDVAMIELYLAKPQDKQWLMIFKHAHQAHTRIAEIKRWCKDEPSTLAYDKVLGSFPDMEINHEDY
jgi:hypothetical protein